MRKRRIPVVGLVLLLALASAGCPKGSTTHKIIAAQHNFRIAVQAFQDAEVGIHNQPGGLIPDGLHIQIQEIIGKVARGGIDLDEALAANAPTSTIKTKLDSISTLLDSLNNDNLLGIKDTNTKLGLQTALLTIKGIITTAETWVTQ